jgi:hypothetical protein
MGLYGQRVGCLRSSSSPLSFIWCIFQLKMCLVTLVMQVMSIWALQQFGYGMSLVREQYSPQEVL